MSVINQMLMDLERRRASGEERKRIPTHVRALPGDPDGARSRLPVIAGAAVIAALAIGGWWWTARLPAAPAATANVVAAAPVIVVPVATAPAAAPVAQQEAVELIAQRMSLDLANVPEAMVSTPDGKPSGLATAAVISRPDSVAVAEPALPRAERAAPVPAVKKAEPAAVSIAPPQAEIAKKVREQTPRQRADTEYAKGVAALQRGRRGEAQAAFEAALQIDPVHHAARQALVGVLLDARKLADAAQLLQAGVQLAPEQFGFAMALARLQMERGELDAAAQTLSRSLSYADSSADYIAFYAGLLQRQQNHVEAIEQFQRALRLRGNTGVWLLGLGVSLDALGRRDDAMEAYRRANATGNLSPELRAFAEQRLR